ncbi:MAG: zinc ribbon domain-containing protein [Deltaproteobacteria bacterium]|nr:zinc ribbon domain-containing protein [Deltaproteobacteria bacterium]
MPLYEYQCDGCKKVFEVSQKFSDKPLTKCEECSGKLEKLMSSTSFQLKGGGWYQTEYGTKKEKPKTESKNNKDKKQNSKTETKTESKIKPKSEAKVKTKTSSSKKEKT